MEFEGLDLDNILDADSISLFNSTEQEDVPPEEKEDTTNSENKDTTEVDPNSLFDSPESVGSDGEDTGEKEDTFSKEGEDSSPKTDFFSSIAEAFVEEGILPDLDEEKIKEIKSPEDLRTVIDDYIKSELNEQQQRVKEALDNNVESSIIRQYENVLGYLNSISEDDVKAENEQGEELRKRLLYQDYVNRGFDKKRAEKMINKAVENGTDIEDALEALEGNKSFYTNEYNKVIEEAKQEKRKEEEEVQKRVDKLKKSILDEKNKLFGDLEVDKKTRQRVLDNISKPIYKDKNGEVFTALQKFERENNEEFIAKVGLIFTLTDGFKNLDGLVKNKVRKEVKKGFRELENKINNTSRDSFGNLKFSSGTDSNSYFGKGIKLAF